MRPVIQTIVDDGKGDCLRACICSLLDLSIDDVPNFAEMGFFQGLDTWLASRGLRFIRFQLPEHGEFEQKTIWFGYAGQEGNPEYMLAWGKSPRTRADGTHRQHIVVAQANGYGIKIVHDPHISGDGLLNAWGFGWVIPA